MFHLLLADDSGTLTTLSNVLKVVGVVGIGSLCIGTWWLACRYCQTRFKTAGTSAKAAKSARNAAQAAEQHANDALGDCQLALS